jgi:hypothetical protein
MNTKLIIWIVGLLLGAVGIGVVWYFVAAPSPAPQTTTQPSTTLPVSGSIPSSPSSPSSPGTPTQTVKTMNLATQSNEVVVANDFIQTGVTIVDKADTDRYLLAGNLGYCFSDPQKCRAGPATDFTVYYNSGPQSFTIELTKEPIGQARLDMEQFLLGTLGLSQQQMCSLNYYVGVTIYVNARFTGKNLGFSFCPGATALPQ